MFSQALSEKFAPKIIKAPTTPQTLHCEVLMAEN